MYTTHDITTHTDELKKRYAAAANKSSRRHGVVSSKGIDCSLREHRLRWKKMDEARMVGLYYVCVRVISSIYTYIPTPSYIRKKRSSSKKKLKEQKAA